MRKGTNRKTATGGYNRRKFIVQTSKAMGSAMLLTSSIRSFAKVNAPGVTVGEIIDKFISEAASAPIEKTVDTLKAGDRSIQVTGIVTTMFATVEVIKKAIATGANFIIAHEPVFYNHADETDWLANDPVYQYKKNLLQQHNIAVWRNHDYIHTHKPDLVEKGLITKLGWSNSFDYDSKIATLSPITLQALITHAKEKLNISSVRYIGDPLQRCKRVLVMPGAAGGRRQITAIEKEKPDVLLCGEIQEWETAEYVRDARSEGKNLALVVLGHIASEEAGSDSMILWLREKFPAIHATHIATGNSLSFM